MLHGAQIMVAVGRWQDHELRATGGFIGTEPVRWTDAFRGGAHRWMNPIDRLAVGGEVRAFREVTALDKLRMQGDVLTFRATVGGKRLSCRADATKTFARCR